jgi:uncharacterized protein YbjT (DUF2867 family)
VDYSNKKSVKDALAGVDIVICTIAGSALGAQVGIAEAAKEAGVKLFVPSEFGGITEGETEGIFGAKAGFHNQLRALGLPYALFYTGNYSDYIWKPCASRHFYLAIQLTAGQVPGPRYRRWEGVCWWRWRQADSVHLQA